MFPLLVLSNLSQEEDVEKESLFGSERLYCEVSLDADRGVSSSENCFEEVLRPDREYDTIKPRDIP